MAGRRARAVRSLCLTVGVAGTALASATGALAVTSYNGSDYSYDYNNRTYMATCDRESDRTRVRGEWYTDTGSRGKVEDVDGSNGNCATARVNGSAARHRTCEYRDAWPDACGNWQAP